MSKRPTDAQILEATKAWGPAISKGSTPEQFSALYAKTGSHTDHCHFYRQTGTAELEVLHKVWLHSIQDCVMAVEKADLLADAPDGKRRSHIWYRCTGVFANDLTRTKCNNEKVEYLGNVDFLFDEEGKILEGDEWMSNIFYKQPVLDYRVLEWNPNQKA